MEHSGFSQNMKDLTSGVNLYSAYGWFDGYTAVE